MPFYGHARGNNTVTQDFISHLSFSFAFYSFNSFPFLFGPSSCFLSWLGLDLTLEFDISPLYGEPSREKKSMKLSGIEQWATDIRPRLSVQ